MKRVLLFIVLAGLLIVGVDAGERGGAKDPPAGFTSLFNGKDLSMWQNADKQPEWTVENGVIHYTGKGGKNLATTQKFKDFEMWIDWKVAKGGDSGIYLRGKPRVQIWDNDEGSGGLSANKKGSDGQLPLYTGKQRKDKKPGDWNTFYLKMVGAKVTVALNDVIVVDNADFLDGKIPAEGPIELQAHDTPLWFRNVFVREIAPGKR
jgi:Domain of Unknown Function (DUF1080)